MVLSWILKRARARGVFQGSMATGSFTPHKNDNHYLDPVCIHAPNVALQPPIDDGTDVIGVTLISKMTGITMQMMIINPFLNFLRMLLSSRNWVDGPWLSFPTGA